MRSVFHHFLRVGLMAWLGASFALCSCTSTSDGEKVSDGGPAASNDASDSGSNEDAGSQGGGGAGSDSAGGAGGQETVTDGALRDMDRPDAPAPPADGGGAADDGAAACDAACAKVTCDGDFTITSSDEFADLVTQGCTVIAGSLRITQTDLESLEGLAIERVEGDLFVAANPSLVSLEGLGRVRHVGGNLNIVNNVLLTSLDPISGWPSDAVGGSLSIFNNDALPQCAVDAFDAHLIASCTNCSNNGEGTCG